MFIKCSVDFKSRVCIGHILFRAIAIKVSNFLGVSTLLDNV